MMLYKVALIVLLMVSVASAQTFTITLAWDTTEREVTPDGFKIVWDIVSHAAALKSSVNINSPLPYRYMELFPIADAREITIIGVGAGMRCFRVSSYKLNPMGESPYSNEVCPIVGDTVILRLHLPVNLTIKSIVKEP
jgi:hypothetical protein